METPALHVKGFEWVELDDLSGQEEFEEFLSSQGVTEVEIDDFENMSEAVSDLYGFDNDRFWGWVQLYNRDKEFAEAASVYWDIIDKNASIETVEEAYRGTWNTFEEFCEEVLNEAYDIPDHIECYIDYEKVAYDMKFDYTYDEESGIVFDNN